MYNLALPALFPTLLYTGINHYHSLLYSQKRATNNVSCPSQHRFHCIPTNLETKLPREGKCYHRETYTCNRETCYNIQGCENVPYTMLVYRPTSVCPYVTFITIMVLHNCPVIPSYFSDIRLADRYLWLSYCSANMHGFHSEKISIYIYTSQCITIYLSNATHKLHIITHKMKCKKSSWTI